MQTIVKDGKKYKLVPIDEQIKDAYRLTKTIDIEIYPHDLTETMTYVNAVKVVEKLGDGWRMPTITELQLMCESKDEIGTFCTAAASGSGCPGWYWSCTEYRENPAFVWNADFSDGNVYWFHKDSLRLSCRPVRLVAGL